MKQVFAVFVFSTFALLASAQAFAQAPAAPLSVPSEKVAPAASKPTPSKEAAAKTPSQASTSRPTWAELTAPQQQALRPLTATWNSISEPQKRKWLEVSKGYPTLPAADQATMHSRMNEWAVMSPQDRATARLNFAKTKELSKQLTPDEKKAKWETYQALSLEEKAKLAANGSPKPAGAATAVKPVPAQKLAVAPKSLPQLPKPPSVAPILTTTGDTPQNVVTPTAPATTSN